MQINRAAASLVVLFQEEPWFRGVTFKVDENTIIVHVTRQIDVPNFNTTIPGSHGGFKVKTLALHHDDPKTEEILRSVFKSMRRHTGGCWETQKIC